MNEKDVAKKIRETIRNSKIKVLEVVTQSFTDMWFKGKKFSDEDFSRKIMAFNKSYNLDCVLVLNSRKTAVAIKFWEKESQIELKEEKE